MPQVLVDMSLRKPEAEREEEQATEIKADFMSLGGAIILAVTLVVTIFLFLSMAVSIVERLQFAIIVILAVACWLYLINRSSERFSLRKGILEFKAALGRTQRFDLDEITALRLVDLGWNLNGDFYILEIGVRDHDRPVEIGLGPCWHRATLRSFIRAVGRSLEKSLSAEYGAQSIHAEQGYPSDQTIHEHD